MACFYDFSSNITFPGQQYNLSQRESSSQRHNAAGLCLLCVFVSLCELLFNLVEMIH